jgi:hypothetical protein
MTGAVRIIVGSPGPAPWRPCGGAAHRASPAHATVQTVKATPRKKATPGQDSGRRSARPGPRERARDPVGQLAYMLGETRAADVKRNRA